MSVRLAYGAQHVPAGVTAAWGARLIVDQNGMVDYVWDRQDDTGTAEQLERLHAWLNSGVLGETTDEIRRLLRQGRMQTRVREKFVLVDDGTGVLVADTNASAGYCYLSAWLREFESDIEQETVATPVAAQEQEEQ